MVAYRLLVPLAAQLTNNAKGLHGKMTDRTTATVTAANPDPFPSQADVEWGRSVLPSVLSHSEDEGIEEETSIEVAIVGGGLAGLAAAIGLHRAGIPCRVYERAPQLRSVSQGVLSVDPHGLDALEKLHPDLPGLIQAAGNELLQAEYIMLTPPEDSANEGDKSNNNKETPLKVTSQIRDVGKDCREKFGRTRVLMTWAGLQQILASLLPQETIVTSRSLVSFEETEDDVLLHFVEQVASQDAPTTKVRHCVRAKCVLACDGVFSVARQQLFAEEDDDPIYFGQQNWGCVLQTSKLPDSVHPPPNTVQMYNYNGDKGRWMSMVIDGGHSQTFWQLRVADPAMARSLSQTKGRGGLGLPGVHAALSPLVANTQLFTILQATPEAQIFERSIVGRLPAPTWCSPKKQRLALVGDAAHGMHPVCGQGANSAFVSAEVAVKLMTLEWDTHTSSRDDMMYEKNLNWAAALKAYQELRKPKADIVQTYSNLIGCHQASGEREGGIPLPNRETLSKISDWMIHGEVGEFPDRDFLNLLETFDLCAQPGVSKIQSLINLTCSTKTRNTRRFRLSSVSRNIGLALLVLSLLIAECSSHSGAAQRILAFQNRGTLPPPQQQETASQETDVEWEWIEDTDLKDPAFDAYQSEEDIFMREMKPERKLLWMGRMDDGSYKPQPKRRQSSRKENAPHLLRTEQWNVTLAWREKRRARDSTISFEFNENGFVRCLLPEKSTTQTTIAGMDGNFVQAMLNKLPHKNHSKQKYIVGTWRLAPSGAIWKMTWDNTTFSFYADLHLNPFGKHPKMFRGMVIRDRKLFPSKFLRPLVATFSGKGVGSDTLDFSYKNRK